MAQNANQLVSGVTTIGASPRFLATSVLPKQVLPISGGPTLARLLPMGVETATGKWAVWNNANSPAGTGTIKGFLAEPHSSHATDDTLAPIMLAGAIHYDDIPLPSGESAANLKTALRSGMRQIGIEVQGLDLVY